MSEQTTEAGETTQEAGTAPSWDEAFKGEDPAKVRKALDHAREWEKRAKDNATAAQRLAEIEDAQKTETEKTADRIAKAEAEVATVPNKVADALREHLVALHEIDKDDAELFLTGTEPELLLKQVTRLLGQSDKRKKTGNHVPREGNNPTPTEGEGLETVRALFGG